MAEITILPDDVRSAGDLTDTDDNGDLEYSDDDIAFEIRQAEAIVNDELAPHTDKTNRLELVAALIAAAYVKDERHVSQVQQGGRQASFNAERSITLWNQACQMDPTGRLKSIEDDGDFWVVTL